MYLSEIEIWENGLEGTDSVDAIRIRHEKKVLMGEHWDDTHPNQKEFKNKEKKGGNVN